MLLSLPILSFDVIDFELVWYDNLDWGCKDGKILHIYGINTCHLHEEFFSLAVYIRFIIWDDGAADECMSFSRQK